MGVYTRKDSPFYWIWLERARRRGLAEPTRVRADAHTPALRRDARVLADQIYHTRMAALIAGELTPAPKPSIGFTAYAEWYAVHVVATHASRTREGSMLRRFRRWFQQRPLETIDAEAVIEYRTARLAERVRPGTKDARLTCPSTVDREIDLLKRMLATAVPKYLDASPIVGMRRHRETIQSKKRRPRILSPEEETRLLAQTLTPEEYAIIVLALDTLMRLSDVRSLRRDRHYGTYIHVEAPKIDPYDVELSGRARAALDALPVRGPFYFTRRRRGSPSGLASSTVWRMFKRVCEAAGIPYGRAQRGVVFHSLRHTGTTRMLEAGINPLAVMEQGGWTELRQLTRYGRASQASKRRGVEVVAEAAAAIAPPALATTK